MCSKRVSVSYIPGLATYRRRILSSMPGQGLEGAGGDLGGGGAGLDSLPKSLVAQGGAQEVQAIFRCCLVAPESFYDKP
eukprot:6210181-Pleurochrysis_carterae.AAC.1